MKRFTFAVVTLSGCVLGTACQAIVGIEDRVEAPADDAGNVDVVSNPPDAPDSGGAEAATDGSTPCADASSCFDEDAGSTDCPTGCLPPAPAGWKGPSATYDGPESGKPAGCPAEYPSEEVEAHQGLSAPAATCDCGTPVITGRKCSFDVTSYTNSTCTQGETLLATVSGCTQVNALSGRYKVAAGVPTAGTCTYPNAVANKPAPSFTKVDLACGRAQATACSGRAECVEAKAPDAPFARMCIHKDGDVPCPSKDYPARFVAHKGIDDARACSACTGAASAATCGTSWTFRANELQCPTVIAGDRSVGTCYLYDTGGKTIDTAPMQPAPGTCTTTPGTPSGTASSIDPVTFCCTF